MSSREEALRAPATPAATAVPSAPVVRVHALGEARVEVAGRPLGTEDWTYAKPRELLYFLLTASRATKAEIGVALWPDEPTAADIPVLEAAAGRYSGDFLADLAVGGWADARRARLRRRYEEVMLVLGRLLGQQRRYGEAAEVFARLVEHDPFLEAAHRGLMRCHMALGNRARALRQYQNLVELLGADIGTTPAPETTALYGKLRH